MRGETLKSLLRIDIIVRMIRKRPQIQYQSRTTCSSSYFRTSSLNMPLELKGFSEVRDTFKGILYETTNPIQY